MSLPSLEQIPIHTSIEASIVACLIFPIASGLTGPLCKLFAMRVP